MKRYISAPLCSAFIIPGLGQILNQDIKKGLALMAAVFVLLLLGAVNLYLILDTAFQNASRRGLSSETVLQQLHASDFSRLWILAAMFVLAWVYSVTDAFQRGRQIESESENNTS